MSEHGYRITRTQVWEFPPGEAADEEHAMTLATVEGPDYDDMEVEEV